MPYGSQDMGKYQQVTMTSQQLKDALSSAARLPHADMHRGKIVISHDAFKTEGRETNIYISPEAMIDVTGSVYFGPWCMIGARSKIYTHDHIHAGRRPLLLVQEECGVMWQDKYIGADVWIHDGAIVLYQVNRIPDGVILGAGSVLTKVPGPYEIWAGAPAEKVGIREETSHDEMMEMICRKKYSLKDS